MVLCFNRDRQKSKTKENNYFGFFDDEGEGFAHPELLSWQRHWYKLLEPDAYSHSVNLVKSYLE